MSCHGLFSTSDAVATHVGARGAAAAGAVGSWVPRCVAFAADDSIVAAAALCERRLRRG